MPSLFFSFPLPPNFLSFVEALVRNQANRFFVSSPVVFAAVEWKRLQLDKVFVAYFCRPTRGKTTTTWASTYTMGSVRLDH